MSALNLYTDGSCLENPGIGGWAVVFEDQSILSGANPDTTNNRMEIQAILEALYYVWTVADKYDSFMIHSDSAYALNTIVRGWFISWKKRGWKNASGNPVKNVDLWKEVDEALLQLRCDNVQIKFVKVKGHSGHKYNELADHYARSAAMQLKNRKGE